MESTRGSWIPAIVAALMWHPSLWGVALRQLFVLAKPAWWLRKPFLPLPDADYLRFRIVCAYGGDGTAAPDADDVITYLHWCRHWHQERKDL